MILRACASVWKLSVACKWKLSPHRQVTDLRAASEAQRISIQSQEHKYDDLREDIRSLAKSTAELLKVSGAHEFRLNRIEGRIQ